MQETWRWFGPSDPVTLTNVIQAGASGVVTALHEVLTGDVWPLDAILERYVEDDQGIEAIVAEGFDRQTVMSIAKMVDRNEYKRRQAAPGVKVTTKAFGKDRRLPITNAYKPHSE